jgi:hypothetical protein
MTRDKMTREEMTGDEITRDEMTGDKIARSRFLCVGLVKIQVVTLYSAKVLE